MTQPIVFLDFEASGLFGRTWPVEAGYASSGGGEDAFLIARHESWSLADWDRKSAQIHGISLEDLAAEGLAADVALARLEAGVGDALVVSDAADFDNHWLGMMAEAVGRPARFEVRDWNVVLPTGQSYEDRKPLFAEARSHERRLHRAAADARVMRAVWKASWEMANGAWA